MRFLADESCDFSVVRALRSADHDVVAIAEISPREEDSSVMERAAGESRILLTEDKDFGQLVYASLQRTGGVIFILFPARAHGPKAEELNLRTLDIRLPPREKKYARDGRLTRTSLPLLWSSSSRERRQTITRSQNSSSRALLSHARCAKILASYSVV
jgi:hypothetical protein